MDVLWINENYMGQMDKNIHGMCPVFTYRKAFGKNTTSS